MWKCIQQHLNKYLFLLMMLGCSRDMTSWLTDKGVKNAENEH